jgi:hypothetical protein
MHETRNFIVVLALVGSVIWSLIAWFVLGADTSGVGAQRIIAPLLAILFGAALFHALVIEEKLPDHLRNVSGGMYYESDGLSFMPMVRANHEQAELCVYYQNRFENPVDAVIHLRPPEGSFITKSGSRDLHFAFKAGPGDFGVIHQPIAVPQRLQGEVVDVQLAAATHYPRGHGACLRKRPGLACGTLLVDWTGAAFKTGVHEVSGEIPLQKPATLHLSMPAGVKPEASGREVWRQEHLAPA